MYTAPFSMGRRNVVSSDKVKIRNVNVRRRNIRWRRVKMARGGRLKARKREGYESLCMMMESGTCTKTRQPEFGM